MYRYPALVCQKLCNTKDRSSQVQDCRLSVRSLKQIGGVDEVCALS